MEDKDIGGNKPIDVIVKYFRRKKTIIIWLNGWMS